jgi:hypothetical protein
MIVGLVMVLAFTLSIVSPHAVPIVMPLWGKVMLVIVGLGVMSKSAL